MKINESRVKIITDNKNIIWGSVAYIHKGFIRGKFIPSTQDCPYEYPVLEWDRVVIGLPYDEVPEDDEIVRICIEDLLVDNTVTEYSYDLTIVEVDKQNGVISCI